MNKWKDNFFKSTELTESGLLKSKDTPAKELKVGKKVEREHADLVKKIRADVEKNGKLNMSDDQIFGIIAKIHIKEDKNYYEKLINRLEDFKLSPLGKKIEAFIKKNPNPKDKSQFHKYANKIGVNEHKLEEEAYRILTSIFKSMEK